MSLGSSAGPYSLMEDFTLDENGNVIGDRVSIMEYDPRRRRPWYRDAIEAGGPIWGRGLSMGACWPNR